MKLYLPIIAATLFFFSCKNNDVKRSADVNRAATDTANYTTIQWLDSNLNLGVISQGKKAQIKFRFKNTGDKPLYVIDVRPGCGCTNADYPKQAIAPGAENAISVEYDSKKGYVGTFTKNVFVTTNTKGSTSTNLIFKGEIKK